MRHTSPPVIPGGSGPKRAANRSGTCPGGSAGEACAGAVPDGASTEAGALAPGLAAAPLDGARLIEGGVGTEGIEAGGIGGPKMEFPHCAEAGCGVQIAQRNKAACSSLPAPIESPE